MKEEPLTIMTKLDNGKYVCVPVDKLKEFKDSQQIPNKKKIEETKKKSLEEFLKKRNSLSKKNERQ